MVSNDNMFANACIHAEYDLLDTSIDLTDKGKMKVVISRISGSGGDIVSIQLLGKIKYLEVQIKRVFKKQREISLQKLLDLYFPKRLVRSL
jgi:autonomous glycyl radical cofactor GrcA